MHYEIKINDFEGPLDLLLHLIKKTNIDIYDINLADITNSYLEYIKAMEDLNLDVASEYLVVAAELIELKSKSLLPNQEEIVDEFEEQQEPSLIDRLIEYKKYKEITYKFRNLEEKRKEIYTKIPSSYEQYVDGLFIKNTKLSVSDLLTIMNNLIDRKEKEKPILTTITNREYSLKDRISEIKKMLKENKEISLYDLFEQRDRAYVIITFLSILELAKNKDINLIQDKNFENIIISTRETI